jgi:hypothetical protein
MRISRRHASLKGSCTLALAVLSAAAFLVVPPPVHGYNRHLGESDVREAYLFGQRHDLTVAKFFDQYEKKIPPASSAPHVRAIGVRTPYSSVVLRSYQGGSTYTAQRAQADFEAKANIFEIAVWIDIPPRYAANPKDVSMSALAKSFQIELSQGRTIAPLNVAIPPVIEDSGDSISGMALRVEYDVRDVASAPARVKVTGPGAQTVSADFDLTSLR